MATVIAIINLTPDSFSDKWQHVDALLAYADQLWQAGITWWDIGAESTRPGALAVPVEEELARLLPALARIRQAFPTATLSVDTRKAVVAEAAIARGVSWINDVSGLTFDPAMAQVIGRNGQRCGAMIMHSQGTPEVMQDNPQYQNVVTEVDVFLQRQAQLAKQAGITRLLLDPGFGFGKTLAHNLALHKALPSLVNSCQPYPVMIGTSRKTFLAMGSLTGQSSVCPPDLRDGLTAVSTAIAYQAGVRYFRVHNALDTQRQLALLDAIA
jgi:dihydropteroate synthase